MILAAALIGIASVIDGDTIEIHGQRVRLSGVDAPESRQICDTDAGPWRCGQSAALALSELLRDSTVRCEPVARDRYGRTVANCYAGSVSVSDWLVRNGWAMDYPQYSKGANRAAEDEARAVGRGIWASRFVPPWEWRKSTRKPAN